LKNEIIEPEEKVEEVILSPRPHELIHRDDIPDNFYWGDVDGVNYLSWARN